MVGGWCVVVVGGWWLVVGGWRFVCGEWCVVVAYEVVGGWWLVCVGCFDGGGGRTHQPKITKNMHTNIKTHKHINMHQRT